MPHPKASDLSLAPTMSNSEFQMGHKYIYQKRFSLQRTHGTLCTSWDNKLRQQVIRKFKRLRIEILISTQEPRKCTRLGQNSSYSIVSHNQLTSIECSVLLHEWQLRRGYNWDQMLMHSYFAAPRPCLYRQRVRWW